MEDNKNPDIANTRKYFVNVKGQQYGPFTEYAILNGGEMGNWDSNDYVWTQGMPEWKKLCEIFPDNFEVANPTPPDFHKSPISNIGTAISDKYIAAMPIAYFIASALLWSAIVITPEDLPEIIFILFTFLSFVLLGIYAVCITKDRVLIKSLGIEPPSSCWILFPPVYSLKRSEILKASNEYFYLWLLLLLPQFFLFVLIIIAGLFETM